MRKFLSLTRDIDRGELVKREKATKDFLERRRLMAIRLRSDGKTPPEVGEILGVGQCALRNWTNKFNKFGLDGLKTMKNPGGRKRRLSNEQVNVICEWLDNGPSEHHGCCFWTAKQLAKAIDESFGVNYTESGIYTMFRNLGYRRLVAKTHHHKSDPKAAEEFKKNSRIWSRR